MTLDTFGRPMKDLRISVTDRVQLPVPLLYAGGNLRG